MIIVEGPDGAGKTRLVDQLSYALSIPIAPRVVASDTTAMVDLQKWTQENVYAGFQRKIFDRHRLISEPIYGPIMKRTPADGFCDLTWMMEMTTLFYAARPIIIYCMPGPNEVRKNLMDDPHNDEVRPSIDKIYAGYVARIALDFTRNVGRIYNYKSTKWEDLLGWVERELERR